MEEVEGSDMEEVEGGWVFETIFIVPPKLSQGDVLPPYKFDLADKRFYLLGRYDEEKDLVLFALSGGEVGTIYKLSISDGNRPYGWKVKRHGTTKSGADRDDKKDKVQEAKLLQEETFALEDVISVPHGMMRSSARKGIMDAKLECVGPWSFYGPSLPEEFCRCRVKVEVYNNGEGIQGKSSASSE